MWLLCAAGVIGLLAAACAEGNLPQTVLPRTVRETERAMAEVVVPGPTEVWPKRGYFDGYWGPDSSYPFGVLEDAGGSLGIEMLAETQPPLDICESEGDDFPYARDLCKIVDRLEKEFGLKGEYAGALRRAIPEVVIADPDTVEALCDRGGRFTQQAHGCVIDNGRIVLVTPGEESPWQYTAAHEIVHRVWGEGAPAAPIMAYGDGVCVVATPEGSLYVIEGSVVTEIMDPWWFGEFVAGVSSVMWQIRDLGLTPEQAVYGDPGLWFTVPWVEPVERRTALAATAHSISGRPPEDLAAITNPFEDGAGLTRFIELFGEDPMISGVRGKPPFAAGAGVLRLLQSGGEEYESGGLPEDICEGQVWPLPRK